MLDQTWDREQALASPLPAADFLHERYTEMLAEAGPRYADALRLLAATDAPAGRVPLRRRQGPHRACWRCWCSVPVGVGHDDIVEDYALTSATMEAFRAAAAERAESPEALAEIPQLFLAADPLAMSRVLTDVERAHGSVAGYAPLDRRHRRRSGRPRGPTADRLRSVPTSARGEARLGDGRGDAK